MAMQKQKLAKRYSFIPCNFGCQIKTLKTTLLLVHKINMCFPIYKLKLHVHCKLIRMTFRINVIYKLLQ
jgi:hypothetical protein